MEIALIFSLILAAGATVVAFFVLRAFLLLRSTVDRDRASVAQSLQSLRATSETAFGRINEEEEAQLKAEAAVEAPARSLEQAARERLARESSIKSSAVEPASLGDVDIKPGALPALTLLLLQGLSQDGAEHWTSAELAEYLRRTRGVRVTDRTIRAFCHRHGIRPYRPTYRFLRDDPIQQEQARRDLLEVRKRGRTRRRRRAQPG